MPAGTWRGTNTVVILLHATISIWVRLISCVTKRLAVTQAGSKHCPQFVLCLSNACEMQAKDMGISMRQAATRIFSNASGSYSSNVNLAVENSSWSDEQQLQEMYLSRKSFAFNSDRYVDILETGICQTFSCKQDVSLAACKASFACAASGTQVLTLNLDTQMPVSRAGFGGQENRQVFESALKTHTFENPCQGPSRTLKPGHSSQLALPSGQELAVRRTGKCLNQL